MRNLMMFAASLGTLLLLATAIVGCGGGTAATVTPVQPAIGTPVQPAPATAVQPSTGMVAFIGGITSASDATQPGNRNVYTINNNGTGSRKLIDQPLDVQSVYILPDGSKGFFAARAADGYFQIYLAPMGGITEPVPLTTTPGHKMSPMLSADGNKIVFLQGSAVQQPDAECWNADIAVMNADGSNLYLLPAPLGWGVRHPSFSPDGSKIAMVLFECGFGGDSGIFIMNLDGSNLARITPDGPNGVLAVCPAFSPDGKQVVFSSVDDMSVYIVNTDGSGLKRLRSNGWDPLFIGDRIMFVSLGGKTQIYSMKADGTDVMQVTNDAFNDSFEVNVAWWQP